MPHFIIECSNNVIELQDPQEIVQAVFDKAQASTLFAAEGPGGIKVRIKNYAHYTTVNSQADFIHVFGHIMEGRSSDQKKELTHSIVGQLKAMFPSVLIISMNIYDIDKSSYCNKSMV